MSDDKFHSSACLLRFNGTACTCGWDERKKEMETAALRKKAGLKKNKSAIKELIYNVWSEDPTSMLCAAAEKEYKELSQPVEPENMRELVRMARVIARGYIHEVGVDGAPQPDESAEDIVDMAFKVLEGSWIARSYK